jgi:hypothetical protein
MRRLTLFISVALALLAFAIPATVGAKRSHHKRTHHARMVDRNHNGIADRWEHRFRVHKATADPDRDGVQNIGEFHNGTNPRDADTDNDGVDDGDDDANHDGVDDGDEQSGTITSFDGTILKVTLVNGDELKGTVNDGTEIECDDSALAPSPNRFRNAPADSGEPTAHSLIHRRFRNASTHEGRVRAHIWAPLKEVFPGDIIPASAPPREASR